MRGCYAHILPWVKHERIGYHTMNFLWVEGQHCLTWSILLCIGPGSLVELSAFLVDSREHKTFSALCSVMWASPGSISCHDREGHAHLGQLHSRRTQGHRAGQFRDSRLPISRKCLKSRERNFFVRRSWTFLSQKMHCSAIFIFLHVIATHDLLLVSHCSFRLSMHRKNMNPWWMAFAN